MLTYLFGWLWSVSSIHIYIIYTVYIVISIFLLFPCIIILRNMYFLLFTYCTYIFYMVCFKFYYNIYKTVVVYVPTATKDKPYTVYYYIYNWEYFWATKYITTYNWLHLTNFGKKVWVEKSNQQSSKLIWRKFIRC